uniref:Nucleotide-binding alpha-beta plait domain-containing protein n=1 Tax=Tanacetum cinerariifolium TaxID=118510 RepID=A0A6L2JPI3_TANCI|nr:hypothetical protein [Tanacetum cinerariifolium]
MQSSLLCLVKSRESTLSGSGAWPRMGCGLCGHGSPLIGRRGRVSRRPWALPDVGPGPFISGICNSDAFVNRLSNIWMGSYHVFVSAAKFQRQNKMKNTQINRDSPPLPLLKKPSASHSQGHPGSKVPNTRVDKPSFASVAAQGGEGVKMSQEKVNQDMGYNITLSDVDLIVVEDSSSVVLVKVKEVDSICNLYRICRNEGFDKVKIHYVGGLWVWIQFANAKSCEAFKSNESLKRSGQRFTLFLLRLLLMKGWYGLRFQACLYAHGDLMRSRRVCIATKKPCSIDETVSVIIRGTIFYAQVKEIGTWSTTIENDIEGSDSDDVQENDDLSFNMEVNHNEILDDYIKQVGETKTSFHMNDVHVSDDTCSKPPGFETCVKEEEFHEDEADMKGLDDFDGSVPPGFKKLGTAYKGDSPSYIPRSSKCSTSFGNLKLKGKKGFSFINEMNKMIEVGGALDMMLQAVKDLLGR